VSHSICTIIQSDWLTPKISAQCTMHGNFNLTNKLRYDCVITTTIMNLCLPVTSQCSVWHCEFLTPGNIGVAVGILIWFYLANKLRLNYFRFSGRHIKFLTCAYHQVFMATIWVLHSRKHIGIAITISSRPISHLTEICSSLVSVWWLHAAYHLIFVTPGIPSEGIYLLNKLRCRSATR